MPSGTASFGASGGCCAWLERSGGQRCFGRHETGEIRQIEAKYRCSGDGGFGSLLRGCDFDCLVFVIFCKTLFGFDVHLRYH